VTSRSDQSTLAAISRIVVGVDGSPNSIAAVEWAGVLADATGAEVVAVHALGLIERLQPAGEPVPVEHHEAEIGRRMAVEWCEPLVRRKRHFDCQLAYGPPERVLRETVASLGADMVVVGCRGVGGSSLLGSTSTQLAHRPPCPVVVVPFD
jgi:nucleotide-binding universal stress UspA family protein